ncbi:MAG: hypothetical protein COA79_23670 [Planctomycetota bacterium]|nr:MAG: hypothetical protein COA79_23670 [Planctomycetota bacterium]
MIDAGTDFEINIHSGNRNGYLKRQRLILSEKISQLFESHGNRVTGFLVNMLGDYDRARDLTQESYYKLYKYLQKKSEDVEDDNRELHPLLFRIALNLGRDEIRKRKVRKERPIPEGFDFAKEEEPSSLEEEEQKKLIYESINQLPADYKEALMLRDIEGHSYKDVSRILKLEIGTVKSRINRARIKFKNIYLSRLRENNDE